MNCKSLLPDTLTQFLYFPLWSPANPNTSSGCHHLLGYLNLSGHVTGTILFAICCFFLQSFSSLSMLEGKGVAEIEWIVS